MNPPSGDDIDGIIERVLRGDAAAGEAERLAAWRRASPDNERQYHTIERILAAARSMRTAGPVPRRPTAGAIIDASARRTRPLVRGRITRLAPWAIAAAAVLVAVLNIPRPDVSASSEIVTGAAERATVKLADGSTVRLGPSSRLRVNGESNRDVLLEGRAFFAVAKAAGEPFYVRTSAGTATVLGTRFDLSADAGGLRLVVLEGRVALAAERNTVEVAAGEESGVRGGEAASPVRVSDPAARAEWLGSFLAFQATPLREAAIEIERLYGVRVLVADSALASATITATFTDRPIDDVVSVVCSVLNARCDSRNGVISISR
jgi:transmembrane sensor